MSSPDYIVDIDGVKTPGLPGLTENVNEMGGRPWLSVFWRCCGAYSRIYRNAVATAYEGRCPRCQRPVHIDIGPEGTSNRFFEAV